MYTLLAGIPLAKGAMLMVTPPEPVAPPAVPPEGLALWPRAPISKDLTVQLVFWAFYLLLDRASTVFRVWPGTPAWSLPAGLGLAILLCGGMRYAPVFITAGLTAAPIGYHRPLFSWAGIPGTIGASLCFVGGAAWMRSVWHLDLS